MLASSITIAAATLASLGGAYAQVAAWHMDTLRLLANERFDPVVDPNRLSAHMHQIVGGSNFGASYNYADQVASSCTSASITADKSNYWMPKLYWINDDQSFVPLPAFHRFYYFLGRNSPVQPVAPFPEGLRMLAGDPMGKASNGISSFTCHVNADLFTGSIHQDNFNFNVPCPYGIRVETIFPTCWNGQDLYKTDQSHMSYPAGPDNRQGQCPWTHPIRVPQIMLEFTWSPSAWAPGVATNGHLAWANGDTTGYGVHADFVNGWDTKVLETALNNTQCAGSLSAQTIQTCEIFAPYYNSNPQCSPSKGQMNEPGSTNVDLVPIDVLPGCNPIWGAGAKPVCTSTPSPDISKWLGTDGSLVATGAQNKARKLPTTPGWAEVGCLKDTNTMLTGGYSFFDTAVSVTSCTAACSKAGYNYAAVGTKNGRTDCQCGTGVVEQASIYPGMCTATCPGDSKQICGGKDIHSIYYAPPGTPLVNTTLPNNTDASYTGCYSPAGSSSLSTKISYQYQDNALTTEGCLQICANKNATWGATTAGRNCLCGVDSSLGSGYYVGQNACSQPCGGNSSQVCGMTSVYSLYNITGSSYKRQTIQHPVGWQGCFNDPGMAGLTAFSWARDDMTAQQCTYGCAELGYKRAGLLFGTRCRCGDEWKGGALYPYTQCQIPCGGNSTETCGGNYITEVYDTTVVAAQLKADIAAKPAGWSGCFANSNGAIFKDYSVYDGSMTEQRCAATCKTYGFGWVGLVNGATCKCSKADPTTTNQQWPSKQYCTSTCAGDTKLTCGGPNQYVEAYDGTAALADNSTFVEGYKGCYAGLSGLSGPTWTQTDMNLKICQTGCKEMGYSLAGNSGNACYCGSSWTKGDIQPDYKCTTQCPGNSTQICGAYQITSLWESRLGAAVPATAQVGYLGCFTDSGSARTLTGFSYSSSSMSNNICKSTCKGKGFSLAGTQGQQCFCDNQIQNGQGRTSSSLCTTACPGLSSAICGGYYKFSVFNSSATSTTASGSSSGAVPSASASGTTSRGCFSDLTVLNSNVYSSGYMTIDQCLSYCKTNGQAYAGIAFGNTCRCGSTMPVVNAGRASCNTACVSNSKQASCGGNSVMDVWPTTQTGFIDAYSAAAADSTGYMGCWIDASTRLLNGTTFTTNSMTPTSCQANCFAQGYQFAGVESNNQCYCSHQVRTGTQRLGEDRCSYSCVGDKTTKCGGNWAVNVYSSAKGATTPSFSISASSSASKSASSGSASGSSASKSASSSAAPSSAPSSAAIEGYKGCYGLGSAVSGAKASSTGSGTMTIGFCRRFCRVQGLSAAILQNGNNCYCSTQANLGTKQPDSACTRACSGDGTTSCGDVYLASVYDTVGAGAVVLAGKPASYVGCFIDSSARILPDFTFTSGSMTADICRRSCAAKGASTWGTESGNQCYCKIAAGLPKSMVTDEQCNSNCAGSSTEKCGGSWKMSVYNADFQEVVDDAETSTASSSSASPSVTSSSTSSSSSSSVASSIAPSSSSSSSAAPTPAASSSAATSSSSVAPSSSSSAASSTAASSSASSSDAPSPSSAAASSSASITTEVLAPVSSSSASSPAASSSSSSVAASSSAVASSSVSASSSAAPESSAASTSAMSSEASRSSAAASSTSSSASATPSPSPSPAPSPSTTSSSTSSAAPPSATNHLGCFSDSTSAPVLSQNVITCDVLTPGMCKLWCNSNNMAYAGMTNANTCGCANDITALASAPAAQCSKQCFSDKTVQCGGEVGTYDVWKSSALVVARRDVRRRKVRTRQMDVIEGGEPLHFDSEKEILEYIHRDRS